MSWITSFGSSGATRVRECRAVVWYEGKERGLSRDFLDELDHVVRLIRRYPRAGMQIEPDIRRFLLMRFPYSLIYGIEKSGIVVIAVANQHREPSYWSERIGSE
jgi:toxin ParE2